MGRRKPIVVDVVESRLKIIHNDDLTLVRDTYKGVGLKATFVDVEFGAWEAYVSNVLAGHGHPKRGHLKSQQTNLVKYGSISPLGGEEIRKKIAASNLEKYGATNVLASNIIKARVKQTMLDRYGVDNAQKSPCIREKTLQTMRDRYGVDVPLQSSMIMEKSKRTCLERYGVENPMQNQATRDKSVATCLARYGVSNASQDPATYRKMLSSKRNTVVIKHWKTGEDLFCCASYEVAAVKWFNLHEVDFDWQVKFVIPVDSALGVISGKTYTVDAFVKGDGLIAPAETYVEIKGRWMQELSRSKWEWFHMTYPNSELWTGPVLKEMGILGGKN